MTLNCVLHIISFWILKLQCAVTTLLGLDVAINWYHNNSVATNGTAELLLETTNLLNGINTFRLVLSIRCSIWDRLWWILLSIKLLLVMGICYQVNPSLNWWILLSSYCWWWESATKQILLSWILLGICYQSNPSLVNLLSSCCWWWNLPPSKSFVLSCDRFEYFDNVEYDIVDMTMSVSPTTTLATRRMTTPPQEKTTNQSLFISV